MFLSIILEPQEFVIVDFLVVPIKKSSPVYKIAVVRDEMPIEEEEELLSDVTQILMDEFVEVNKTLIID